MSLNISLINDLGRSIKQLHDNIVDLKSRVNLPVDAGNSSNAVSDVNNRTGDRIPKAISSANQVADQLSIIIAALVPAILDTDHDFAWCLGIMEFSIRKFVAISNRIINSKVQDIQLEDVRKMHFAIRQVLMYVRGSKKLMKDIMELPGARKAITAVAAGAGVAVKTAAEAAASATDTDTSNSV